MTEKRHLRLAVRHRIRRKAVAEIGHRVFEPLGERRGAGERGRAVREELRHRLRRLQVPFGVSRQLPSRGIERRLVANAREHVEERAVGGCGKPHIVGGDDRHAERAGKRFERDIGRLFIAQQMALQLDAHVASAEETDDAIEQAADAVSRRVEHGTSGKRHEPGGVSLELVERERALPFRRPHLHARDQPAQIRVSSCAFDETAEPFL